MKFSSLALSRLPKIMICNLGGVVLLCLYASISIIGCTSGSSADSKTTESLTTWAKLCINWDEWDKPGPAYRIYGNTYYVGTCGISAILIVGNQGHILIDGGTEAGAELIMENIKNLGFSIHDVKLLLHSHEHFDHVAGLALIQQISGAQLVASPEAAAVFKSGIVSDQDPQAGMHNAFPPARVDQIIDDGFEVRLGKLLLKPIATPGHSPGALSWQWKSCENDQCLSVVYADSLSPVSSDYYRFGDHLLYVSKYRAGLGKLAALECDILITPHPSSSQMPDRLSSSTGLVDKSGCRVFAASVSSKLDNRLAKEQQARVKP